MKMVVKQMSPYVDGNKKLNVVIETPKGSRIKYAYDFETGLLKLDRTLPEGMVFPFNFGFIPGTKAEDGDPLDLLVLNEEPLFPGCLVNARLIGVILAQQTEKGETVQNDRLIGLAIGKDAPTSQHSAELDKRTATEIECFFVNYNKLAGRRFKIRGRGGPKKAMSIVHQYEEKQVQE